MFIPFRAKGFTLIELLVVMAIIGILSSIIMVSVSGMQQRARDNKRLADLKIIQLALATYYSENGMYPLNIYAAAGTAPGGGLAPAYLAAVPRDPKANGTEACSGTGVNTIDNCYHYYALSTGNAICDLAAANKYPVIYHLGAKFEDSSNTELTKDIDGNQTLSNIYTTAGFARCSSPSPAPTAGFDGNATSCQGSTATTPDPCYDLVP